MRRLLLILAFLVGTGVAAFAQTTLSVLAYNIHRDIGASDSNTGSQGALAQVVNYLKPDVWTINELGGNNVSFSATNARNYLVDFIQSSVTIFGANPQLNVNYYVYVGGISDGFITNAIVSRYPFLNTTTYSDAGGTYGAVRGLTSAYVDVPGTVDVGVFTAHLKALSDDTSAAKRQAEAKTDASIVTAWIASHSTAGAIVTGDWNETETAGESANWSGHAIGDTLPNGDAYHPVTTMKSPGLTDSLAVSIRGDPDTIDSSNPTSRFDYTVFKGGPLTLMSSLVFDTKQYTSGQLSALNAANGTSFVAGTSALASDHLPVFTRFTVIPEPSTLIVFASGVVFLGFRRKRGFHASKARRD